MNNWVTLDLLNSFWTELFDFYIAVDTEIAPLEEY